jgi:hypothetical protein
LKRQGAYEELPLINESQQSTFVPAKDWAKLPGESELIETDVETDDSVDVNLTPKVVRLKIMKAKGSVPVDTEIDDSLVMHKQSTNMYVR